MSEYVEIEAEALPSCRLCWNTASYYNDALTTFGAWTYLCETCWLKYGPGKLGIGFGQRLVLIEVEEG